MSPYNVVFNYDFNAIVNGDGFRIILYQIDPDIDTDKEYILLSSNIVKNDCFIKFNYKDKPSNMIVFRSNISQYNPLSKSHIKRVKCSSYSMNIENLLIKLLKLNNIEPNINVINRHKIGCAIREKFDNCFILVESNNEGRLLRKYRNTFDVYEDSDYYTIEDIFTQKVYLYNYAVKFNIIDIFECIKSRTDSRQYISIVHDVNKLSVLSKNKDFLSDNIKDLRNMIPKGLPAEFVYNAMNNENIVFGVETIFREEDTGFLVWPYYKTILD